MANNTTKVGAGVGIAALAAAGAYFLYGKRGAKNREKIKGWVLKAKGEVLDKMENLKHVNKDTYNELVDDVTSRYKRVKKASGPEIKKLKRDLKSAWGTISKELKKT